MNFLKIDKSAEAVADTGSSKYIVAKSGMYPVTIKHAIISQSPNGSQSIDLVVEHEGQSQTIYGFARVTSNNGELIDYGVKKLNQLAAIINFSKDEWSPVETKSLALGKDKTEKSYTVMPDLKDRKVVLLCKRKFEKYNSEMRQSTEVHGIYRPEDFATASEIRNANVEGVVMGSQYKKDLETASSDILDSNITQNDVDCYLDSFKGGSAPEVQKDQKPQKGFASFAK